MRAVFKFTIIYFSYSADRKVVFSIIWSWSVSPLLFCFEPWVRFFVEPYFKHELLNTVPPEFGLSWGYNAIYDTVLPVPAVYKVIFSKKNIIGFYKEKPFFFLYKNFKSSLDSEVTNSLTYILVNL